MEARADGRTVCAAAALLAALVVIVPAAHASGPSNDNFDAAEVIEGESGSVDATNVGATRELGEPSHGGPGGASVWYRWTAPFSGHVLVETCDRGSLFDTVLAMYVGTTLPALEQLAADDDGCGLGSRIVVAVTEGVIYHVAVDGFDEDETGNFTLRWRPHVPEPAPPNDNFASARVLAGARGQVTGTTIGATRERGEPMSPLTFSVWYRWRAPRPMLVAFSTCETEFDTVVGVFRGGASVAALTLVGRDYDGCSRVARALSTHDPGSRVTFWAQGGTTYHIRVAGLPPGPFALRWQPAPCVVPQLRGKPLSAARVALSRSGCSLGLLRYVDSTLAPRGVVVEQWPDAGTRLPPLGRVRVAVSRGR